MSHDWPTTGTAPEIGRHVLFCVNRFLEQHPSGNSKNWNDLKNSLFRWVQKLDPELGFSGLVWILKSQTRYQYQLVAGELLDRACLKGTVPLPELLEQIVPQFEESASTVPIYLANSFGKDTVVECLETFAQNSSSPQTRSKVKVLLYWLGER
jgi:hypothetical protein